MDSNLVEVDWWVQNKDGLSQQQRSFRSSVYVTGKMDPLGETDPFRR